MLSHLRISAAKPAAKPFNLSDGQGLFLTVQPNGSKLWKLSFRHFGKQKTLHLGLWPDVSLADARDRRDEARRQIASGLDPAVEKKRARIAAKVAAANTFKDVAEEWLQKCEREGRAEITLSKIRWLLSMAYPIIGKCALMVLGAPQFLHDMATTIAARCMKTIVRGAYSLEHLGKSSIEHVKVRFWRQPAATVVIQPADISQSRAQTGGSKNSNHRVHHRPACSTS